MSENVKQEQLEQGTGLFQPDPVSVPQFEVRELNPENLSPLLVDNKQVYYQGFLSMSEEDKAKVLLGFLLASPEKPNPNNLEPESVEKTKAQHELWKDKELFSIKKYGTISFLSLAILGIIIFLGVFVYITLKQGVLDENGILSGLLTSVQEVLRILFTSPGDI